MSFEKITLSDNALLSVLQHTKEAIAVYVSPEMHIGFINISMMKLWEKTSPILGQKLADAAPEFEPFLPILENVWKSGERYLAVDTPANINYDGRLIEQYFDFEYRPVLDSARNVVAIINTATNVTERHITRSTLEKKDLQEVNLRNELIRSNNELIATQKELAEINLSLQIHLSTVKENEQFLRRFIMQAPAALTLLRGRELVYDIFNSKYQELVPDRNLKGRSIFEALPELVGTSLETVLNRVYADGIPYTMTDSLIPISEYEGGPTFERYFTFNFVPWYGDNGQVEGIMNLAYEVTDQVLARKQVSELNAELQKVNDQLIMAAEAGQIGTWFIEPDTKVLTYNSVLAHIFGYDDTEPMTYEQAIGQVLPEFRTQLVAEIERAIDNGNHYDVMYQQEKFNDKKIIWLRSTGQISVEKGTGLVTFSGVVQDITRQRLEEQRKDTFIGIVSHELRTPLTSLNGFVQILVNHAGKAKDEFATSLLNKTSKQVLKMTKMINGFLNVSRLESGHISIEKVLFPIYDLIQEIADECAVLYQGNLIKLLKTGDVEINADRDKIGQVISNLVSNAVKYSAPQSDISISYVINNEHITISVIDHGLGISPQEIDKLFTRYYRVESKATKSISGFGIGLYLCKEIIEQHGGKIGAESIIDHGSEFWFTLPLGFTA